LENMVVMGRVVAPYGILGWLKIQPSTELLDGLLDYDRWWLGRAEETLKPGLKAAPWREFEVETAKIHADFLIVKLVGVNDREAAMALKSQHIAVPRDALPALSEDEYYWSDLIGMQVVNLQQQALGQIQDVFATGANDVLVVEDSTQKKQRLLPFVAQTVIEVNTTTGVVTVDWLAEWD